MRKYQAFFAALIAILFVGTSAKAIDIDRESELKRASDNETRVALMHPYMRPKIRAVIGDLESHGWRPLIDAQVYRSPAQQAKLKARGVSSVSYSYHMVTDKDAKGRPVPASLAADITDKRWAWKSGNQYWLMLASASESHGLVTGIRWTLPTSGRQKIDALIRRKDWKGAYSMGRKPDPAHVEVVGVSLGQAKKGVRPVARNPPAAKAK